MPEQKLVVVMGLFADSNTTAAGTLEDQEHVLVEKLNAYWEWANSESRIVGLNVWHWIDTPPVATQRPRQRARSNPATEYNVGTESLPRVITRLAEIRAQLDAPPAPPSNLPPIRWHYVNGTLRPFYPIHTSSGHRDRLGGG